MATKQVDLRNTTLFVITRTAAFAAPGDVALTWPAGGDAVWQAVTFGEGNLTYTFNDAPEYSLDRGRLDDVRFGDESPIDVSFEGKFDKLIVPGGVENTDLSLTEMVVGRNMRNTVNHGDVFVGLPESWLVLNEAGTVMVGCVPYCCWLEFHDNPQMECPEIEAAGEASLFRYFRQTSVAIDIDAGQISVDGQAHIRQPIVAEIAGGDWEYNKNDLTNLAPAVEGGVNAFPGWVADPRA